MVVAIVSHNPHWHELGMKKGFQTNPTDVKIHLKKNSKLLGKNSADKI